MKIETVEIPGVLVLLPKVFEDERGFFLESYNKKVMKSFGIREDFIQDNQSKSVKNVVRGLHYQKTYPQGKLVRVLQGAVLDVIVDIRIGSPTFGKWLSFELSADNKKQIWVPGGLAHGYAVLSETAEFFYKVTEYYHPEDECGIRWDDPELDIDWKTANPIISAKDKELYYLKELSTELPQFKPDSL